MLSYVKWSLRQGQVNCSTRQTFTRAFARASSTSTSNKHGNAGEYVCHLKNISFALGNGKKIFDKVNLAFYQGAKIGILGMNGAGKSTLIKIISGLESHFEGERWVHPGVRIGYLAQEPELDATKNVEQNVMEGLQESQDLLDEFEKVSLAMGNPDADFDTLLDQQAELQMKIDELNCWDLQYEVDRVMQALRVPPRNANVTVLSGGERRRIALCRLLLEQPDMLILDEPTNHLDATSVKWLERFLSTYKGTVLSITHDRYFLDNVAGWILEIERGQMFPHEGNYTSWMEAKAKRYSLEHKKDVVRSKLMQKELEWIRDHQGGKKGSKARLNAMAELKKEQTQDDDVHRVGEGQIIIPPGPRLGNKVISIQNISKTYVNDTHETKTLLENFSLTISKNAIVGIVGGNGCGKSTLVKMIAGEIQPDSGSIELGETVRLGFVSQDRNELNPKHTVYEEITNGNDMILTRGNQQINARAYVAAFNLKGQAQEKRVGNLSGGERNRVQLAKMLLNGHNVIILDEPTNDLDVDTLRSLEMALTTFDGTVILISHDRWFLDRVCTDMIAFEERQDGQKTVVTFPGNYSEYAASRKGLSATLE